MVVAGDFNCFDIDWVNLVVRNKAQDKKFNKRSLTSTLLQLHDKPTRENTLLYLIFN
ncbi:hypothetical protein DPMN_053763 [Dreissena polymorpha]|uniref:Endonuclease/exonuclease/phosphatase domain-containing protein n=1 Tax=Dreissena polymorpha TaxID=45954 RepID=A0A9D4CLZ5_DREPO|nr:hypothetical protein DPMN_053763 [Dreissena polymorpha]